MLEDRANDAGRRSRKNDTNCFRYCCLVGGKLPPSRICHAFWFVADHLKTFEELLQYFYKEGPGVKKVQRREYEIEDGRTRTALSRSQPWSFFAMPGRKVDMSMIFKDKSKTSVVCPKCDTISHEKKGILIEWYIDYPDY